FLPIKVGNLRKKQFKDIWQNSEDFKILRVRANLKGACGECDFRLVCGGCRARAFAYHGDYLASDVGCLHAKKMSRSPE
ncbi:SPASM domain-containing protein, partial [Candidatus Bathyarchaeota archaeon]|nr:SPASM domain-containing protein [Candidatus Bathyarchaeota archaeon]